ncbi:MAG: helix-turn-helix transcriptional regulator [Ktedonobacteraceae bacterium]|nr:helix-turn-helix transcriptional regulator [Ktedonobacteraceae bacterium]
MNGSNIHPLKKLRRELNISQEDLAVGAQVSLPTIKRAERGEPLRDDVISLICEYISKEARHQYSSEELGLQKRRRDRASLDSDNTEHEENETAVWRDADHDTPQIHLIEDDDVLDRLMRAVKKPAGLDQSAIALLEAKTRDHWQLYANFDTSVQYKYDMLDSVIGHLRTITHLMEHPQPTYTHNHLSFLASETTQLTGEIFFDLKANDTAERYYNASIEMAREAQDPISLAVTLGRKSFIPTYNNDAVKALPLLQEAYSKLTDDSSDIIRAWLSAREAEVHAHMGNADACFEALERAELHLARARPEMAPSYAFASATDIHFTRSMLLGFKGACYTRLNLPSYAQAALEEDLAIMNPARTNHRAIVLVDLAKSFVQQGQIEEACKCAEEVLSLMVQLQSARVFQRLLGLRHQLEPFRDVECVKRLDRQLITVPYIQGEVKRAS